MDILNVLQDIDLRIKINKLLNEYDIENNISNASFCAELRKKLKDEYNIHFFNISLKSNSGRSRLCIAKTSDSMYIFNYYFISKNLYLLEVKRYAGSNKKSYSLGSKNM